MRDFVILTDSCCDLTPELAQELGCTDNCVRMRLTRARRRAAGMLANAE